MSIKPSFFTIRHALAPGDLPVEERKRKTREALEKIRADGYDGIVHNLFWGEGYPDDADAEKLLRYTADVCKDLSLKLWLYDEKGYPSGACGGKTLAEDPAWEAKAVACEYRLVPPGETHTMLLPRGHLRPLFGCAYPLSGNTPTEEELSGEPLTVPYTDGYIFTNDTGKDLLCFGFFEKYGFEGMHAEHNAFAVRRYIDVLQKDAVEAFVRNTYEPLTDLLRDRIDDGTVEAFFSDEASLMGTYFNLVKVCPVTVDVPDKSLPLFASVPYSDTLPSAFSERYGYDLLSSLPSLFFGESEKHRRVRADYYELLSDRFESSFFGTVSRFCEQNHVASSGHILLEEDIFDHPRFEGNFFSLLRRMHVPGMDMLDSTPERVYFKAFTPALVHSVSVLWRDGHVMDEVSEYFQLKYGVPVTAEMRLCALLAQYALGADIFHSYYGDDALTVLLPSGKTLLQTVKETISEEDLPLPESVALYYPIEETDEHTVAYPDHREITNSSKTERHRMPFPLSMDDWNREGSVPLPSLFSHESEKTAVGIDTQTKSAMYALLDTQVPFLFADCASFEKLPGRGVRTFVIPELVPSQKLIRALPLLRHSGIRIVAVTGKKPESKNAYRSLSDVICVESVKDLRSILAAEGFIRTCGDTEKVLARFFVKSALLVNTEKREKIFSLTGAYRTAADLYTGKDVPLTVKGETTSLTIPAYGTIRLKK